MTDSAGGIQAQEGIRNTARRDNPYISRGPVQRPEMFFGRRHELQEITAFLRGNQSVSLVGPRKIGKTSLLFHLMRLTTREQFGVEPGTVFVYLDCEVLGEADMETIFGLFAGEIALTLGEMALPPEPALENVINKPSRLAFEGALRKLNQRGLRVVLILDEFERLSSNNTLDVNFFNALRSAAGRYQFVFITASARPLITLTYSERSHDILSSPFFNIFAPMFLGPLAEPDARSLINTPSDRAGLSFPPPMIDHLYEYAGGHPLALQVACFYAFNTPDSPAQAEENATRELDAHFQYYWRNLTSTEQDTLRRVYESSERAHDDIPGDTTLRAALRDLVQKSLLVADGGVFRFPSRAWAEFVGDQGRSPATRAGGLLVGARLGQYEVMEPIGRGGMAEVYRGVHVRLGRSVAIKVLSPGLATEADFRHRFEREARAIAALKHPNIVGVFDFGDIDGLYYMVMEYIAGQTLTQHMRAMTTLFTLDDALCVLREVASALDYAHSQGFVHRDVKPSNIMLETITVNAGNPLGVRAVLTDFGIAKMLRGGTGTKTEGVTGTLDYIAPEQISGEAGLDGRADVYALGVVTYQMLTGTLPFYATTPAALMMAHLQTPPTNPRIHRPDLPEPVAVAVLRALAKNPAERFPTAGTFVRALGE